MLIFPAYLAESTTAGKLDIGLYSIYYCRGRFIILVFKVIASHKSISLVFYSILAIFPTGGGTTFPFVMKYFV